MRFFIENLMKTFHEEQSRHILWLPVLFGLGIGLYFALDFEPSLWLGLIILEALILFIWFKRFNAQALFVLGIFLTVALGYADASLQAVYHSKQVEPPSAQELTYLQGRIKTLEYNAKGHVRLLLTDVSDFENSRKGLYRVTLNTGEALFQTGVCVEMVATVSKPALPAMPHGYQFDRKAFFEGISAVGFTNSAVYQVPCATHPFRLSEFLEKIRTRVVSKIEKSLPADEAGIVAALIAGYRAKVSTALYEKYRDAGLAHFLSISGLHIGLIAAMAFFVLRLLMAFIPRLALQYDSRKPAAVFAILMSFLYLLISGMGIPAQRAFLMALIVFAGILFSREAVSMRTAAIAALVMLVISPQILISAGFQMSFAAVVVLIAFYERYARPLHAFFAKEGLIYTFLAYFVGLLATAFVAGLATMPFTIYHFNQIAVYSLLGNLLAGPIIGFVVMPFVLVSLVLLPFGLAKFPLYIVGFGIKILNDLTAFIAGLPHAGFEVMSMPLWGLIFIVLGGLWLCLWQLPWRRFGLVPIVLGVLSIFCVQKPDMLYDASGKAVAVADTSGRLVVLPSRGQAWVKNMWLEKTASAPLDEAEQEKLADIYKGKTTDLDWLNLVCDAQTCVYRDVIRWQKGGEIEVAGQIRNHEEEGGAAVYLNKNGARVETVRQSVGFRFWN